MITLDSSKLMLEVIKKDEFEPNNTCCSSLQFTAAGSDKVKVKDQHIKEEISLMEGQCEQATATAKQQGIGTESVAFCSSNYCPRPSSQQNQCKVGSYFQMNSNAQKLHLHFYIFYCFEILPVTVDDIKLVDQYCELSDTSSQMYLGLYLGLPKPYLNEIYADYGIQGLGKCELEIPGLAWGQVVMGCSSEGSLKGRLQQNCQEIANKHFVISQTSCIVSVCLHPNQSIYICSISNIV